MEFPTEKRVEEFFLQGKKNHTKPFDNMSLDFLAIYRKEQYNNNTNNTKLQWNFSFTINFRIGKFFFIFLGGFCAAEQQ